MYSTNEPRSRETLHRLRKRTVTSSSGILIGLSHENVCLKSHYGSKVPQVKKFISEDAAIVLRHAQTLMQIQSTPTLLLIAQAYSMRLILHRKCTLSRTTINQLVNSHWNIISCYIFTTLDHSRQGHNWAIRLQEQCMASKALVNLFLVHVQYC